MAVLTELYKVVATWTGFAGQPGYTSVFFDSSSGTAQQAADKVRSFLLAAAGVANNNIPAGVKITFPSAVEHISASSGAITLVDAVTPPAQLTGNGSGNYSSAVGAVVTWITGDFLPVLGKPTKTRRVVGRTFIVPTAPANTFDTDGTLSTAFMTSLNSAISGILAGTPQLAVWHRPTSPGATDGSGHLVNAGQVHDKTAVLTSRRD